MYGGIEKFDAGKFYHDADTISHFSEINFTEYIKLLFGFQNDGEGSYLYENCIIHTDNWDNGKVRDFFYNDNRIIIRLHSLLNFLPFSNYFVQALFNCFLSFIGITFLYKSFKDFFIGKEIGILIILCFFPALWFYTGAVLKEGITVLCLGSLIYLLKLIITQGVSLKRVLFLILFISISFLLKPYILLLASVCFTLFFSFSGSSKIKYKSLLFIAIFISLIISANGLSLLVKNKSLFTAAKEHQRIFADVAKGGIFLLDEVKFVRLRSDTNLVQRVPSKHNIFKIKQNVPYAYWEHSHQKDTLYCHKNNDTTSEYSLVYQIAESGSNFNIGSENTFSIISACFYYSLFHPLFYHSKSLLQLLASVENLFIILSLLLIVIGVIRNKKDKFLPVCFLFMAFSVCCIIGFSTPNSGAIFRYRSPIIVFILLSALYYLEPIKIALFKKQT